MKDKNIGDKEAPKSRKTSTRFVCITTLRLYIYVKKGLMVVIESLFMNSVLEYIGCWIVKTTNNSATNTPFLQIIHI